MPTYRFQKAPRSSSRSSNLRPRRTYVLHQTVRRPPHAALLLSMTTPLIYTGHFVFAAFASASMIKYVTVRSIALSFWRGILTLPSLQLMRPECSRITFQAVEAAIYRVIECVINMTGSPQIAIDKPLTLQSCARTS
jgi:hypothetical protein